MYVVIHGMDGEHGGMHVFHLTWHAPHPPSWIPGTCSGDQVWANETDRMMSAMQANPGHGILSIPSWGHDVAMIRLAKHSFEGRD